VTAVVRDDSCSGFAAPAPRSAPRRARSWRFGAAVLGPLEPRSEGACPLFDSIEGADAFDHATASPRACPRRAWRQAAASLRPAELPYRSALRRVVHRRSVHPNVVAQSVAASSERAHSGAGAGFELLRRRRSSVFAGEVAAVGASTGSASLAHPVAERLRSFRPLHWIRSSLEHP
jgi:hypothetical protein